MSATMQGYHTSIYDRINMVRWLEDNIGPCNNNHFWKSDHWVIYDITDDYISVSFDNSVAVEIIIQFQLTWG